MRRSLFLLISVYLFWPSNAQMIDTVKIHFNGKKFERLNLVFVLPDMQSDKVSHKMKISGKSVNGIDWVFSYPDSVYDTHWLTKLEIPKISDTLSETIVFVSVYENDTLVAGQYCFSRGVSNLYAIFQGAKSSRRIFSEPGTHNAYFGTQIGYQFLIPSKSDIELLSSIEAICHGYSMPDKLDSITYQRQMIQYEQLTEKFPNSHFLVFWLNSNLSAYKSKSDIVQIYNAFSDDNKKSYYGKQINNFIISNTTEYEYSVFVNSNLPVWSSNIIEPIIQDTSIYNLVVFSASWCRPCHLLIPILKEIDAQFKKEVIITYVSMDEDLSLKEWGNLLKNENIHWRSMLAKDHLKEMKDKYFAEGIPHTILVYPGGRKAEILNLRLEKDYKKFVSLMSN